MEIIQNLLYTTFLFILLTFALYCLVYFPQEVHRSYRSLNDLIFGLCRQKCLMGGRRMPSAASIQEALRSTSQRVSLTIQEAAKEISVTKKLGTPSDSMLTAVNKAAKEAGSAADTVVTHAQSEAPFFRCICTSCPCEFTARMMRHPLCTEASNFLQPFLTRPADVSTEPCPLRNLGLHAQYVDYDPIFNLGNFVFEGEARKNKKLLSLNKPKPLAAPPVPPEPPTVPTGSPPEPRRHIDHPEVTPRTASPPTLVSTATSAVPTPPPPVSALTSKVSLVTSQVPAPAQKSTSTTSTEKQTPDKPTVTGKKP